MTFTMNSMGNGFGLFYLTHIDEEYKTQPGDLFGYKPDFAGLGIFFTPDLRGNWVFHGATNKGMQNFILDFNSFNSDNTCAIVGNVQNTPRTIKINLNRDTISVMIKGENSGAFEH